MTAPPIFAEMMPEPYAPRIIAGDSRLVLPTLPEGFVQTCVTSPLYWGLRDYDHSGQIGAEASPEEYVENRPTSATEEVFLFAKSPSYFYDPQGVREASGANLRNYWMLGPEPNPDGHPAAFPAELARRCIALGSRPGDTVLDPFGGCGTTGLAARELQRESVLIELNPDYAEMGKQRVARGRK